MNPVVLPRDTVRVLLSTLAGEVFTDTDLTNVETRNHPAPLINNLGDSSAGVGQEAVDVGEVPILVFSK